MSDRRVIFWLNTSQYLSQIGTIWVDELAGVRLRGFASALDRLAETRAFVLKRKVFELHLGGFLHVVVVLLVVAQVRDQLKQAIRNSDPTRKIIKSSTSFHSTATMRYWKKKKTNAISDPG